MKWMLLVLVAACGGQYKGASYAASPPPSVLEQHARLSEPVANAEVSEHRMTNGLSRDVAVRQRRIVESSWKDIAVDLSGGLFAGPSGPSGPPPAQVVESAGPKEPEKLVIEAWLAIQSDDVTKAAGAIRARVEAAGGRVISENIVGAGPAASSAAMELRVPPAQAMGVVTWLGAIGTVESRRVLASDVSKTLFDQQIALDNLKITLTRLQKLAEESGPITDLLEIERELKRVRGEIEEVEGEQRWLLDRVEFATISVTLSHEGGPVELSPHARMSPGPHVAALTLLDPGMRPRSRIGGGVTVHIKRYLTFDLDVFPAKDGDSRAVIATVGTALYSSYLGNGGRRFFNPYVGMRAGYGYLSNDGGPLVAGEVGIELYKHPYLLVETAARVVAFMRETGNDAAFQTLLGFSVPF